ncbi:MULTISPECIES: DUF4861 family protein [Flavobacteriaceae]|uniref:DUF4861 family protein n=1 Tax=Flavobacteriaceae TaxID=49546 RepID=UPI00149227D3|nr:MULTISPECIES: DUF4861 family protein [Allomuricauda]MDC6365912.1 DUF4861 family protein [Muricauda sp. AC10]
MNTGKLIWIALITLSISFGCKEKKKDEVKEEQQVANEPILPKTYAEISIGQGGEWKDRVYENGTSFKNVEELRVPESHTDHSWYVRYEGPGWESNKVGYRLYIDWRNAIDIFGKTTDSMILNQVGQDGFDSYHEKQNWGQDILKVGKALGLGSYGRMVADSVYHFQNLDSTFVKIDNTENHSSVTINYYGWESAGVTTDLVSNLSIAPDSRATKAVLKTSEPVEGLATGIVKSDAAELLQSDDSEAEWGYVATYGEQTLVPDRLGMAIFYKKEQVASIEDGNFDHLVVFKSTNEPITYHFAAAWEGEKDGIKTKEEFIAYLNSQLETLK